MLAANSVAATAAGAEGIAWWGDNPEAPQRPPGASPAGVKAAASVQTGLRLRSLGDLLEASVAIPEAMLGTWLTQRHLSMVYAEAGVGKSFFALAVALAVAGGGEVFGWKAQKARKVLFVDGEMDLGDIKARARDLLAADPGADREAAGGNLLFLAFQDQEPGTDFPDLATEPGRQAVLRIAREVGAELAVLDNFSTLATIEDENAASSFNPILALLRELKQQGSAVLLVHHSRKAANTNGSYRGSQKMAVVFQSIIRLEHPGGVPATAGVTFELVWEKFRGLRDGSIFPMRAELRGGPEGHSWSHGVAQSAMHQEMVRLVRSMEFGSQDELAVALGRSPTWVTRNKRLAVAAGLIGAAEWAECLALGGAAAVDALPF